MLITWEAGDTGNRSILITWEPGSTEELSILMTWEPGNTAVITLGVNLHSGCLNLHRCTLGV